jgi:hypothetical protein
MKTSRSVPVGYGLYYEAGSALGFWSKMVQRLKKVIVGPAKEQQGPAMLFASARGSSTDSAPGKAGLPEVGEYVPFKQSRLKGQINPLRPPLQVETVLIGQALHERVGYLRGIGFRVRDDQQVEAEFPSGVRTFKTYGQFEREVIEQNIEPAHDDNDIIVAGPIEQSVTVSE